MIRTVGAVVRASLIAMAAVVLSLLPLFGAYLVGRRHLLSGLTAGFSK